MTDRFVKIDRYVFNPLQITHLDIGSAGGCTVHLVSGEVVSLNPELANLLMSVLTPVGA
jgi:hypothetical protein